MSYNTIAEDILGRIKPIAGANAVFTDRDDLENYSHDETGKRALYCGYTARRRNQQSTAVC